jgi:PAS domain S-box-containing protein
MSNNRINLPVNMQLPVLFTRHLLQRPFFWLATGLVLVSGCLVALTLTYLRTQAIHAGEQLTEALAQVIEEQTTRTIQTIDQRLQLTASTLARLQSSGSLNEPMAHSILEEQIKDLPFVRVMWVADLKGNVIYESGPGLIGLNVADRAYFQVYLTQPQTGFYLATPVRGRATGKWAISATRPLASADGKFSGLIGAAIEPAYFDKLWRAVNLGALSSTTLFNRDGVLMMRSPFDEASMGKNFRDRPLFSQLLTKNPAGNFQNISPIDGTTRIFSYRTLSAQPELVVTVGQSYELILAPWRQLATLSAAIWTAAAVAIALLCSFLSRASHQKSLVEARVQQLAQRMTLATDAANIGVWDWDLKADQWDATATYFTMLGYDPDEDLVSRRRWIERIHPEDQDLVTKKLQAVFAAAETPYEYEARVQHGNGSFRWISVIGRVLARDDQGRASRLLGVTMDITERKLAQTAMRESEGRYRTLFHYAPDGILIADSKSNYIDANTSICLMLGYSRDELIGLHAQDIVAPAEIPHIGPALGAIHARSDYHREWQFQRKDGSTFSAEVIATMMPDGNLIAMIRDSTERKQAEAARHESEERYRLLVDMSPYAIGVHQGGKIVFANRAGLALFGATRPEELIGHPVQDRIHPDHRDAARTRIGRMLHGETGLYPMDDRYLKLDGSVFDVEVSAAPFMYQDRPAIQVIALDITARKKAEEALRQTARQLQTLSRRVLEAQETERRRVARELHDELGQALTAIKINLHARERFRDQSPQELDSENIRIIEDALQQVRSLALALRPSMLDDLGLIPALRWIAEQTASRGGMAVHFHSSNADVRLAPEIETACFRIAQEALTNVARHANARQVRIELGQDDDVLVLSVKDDGEGFDVTTMRERAKSGGSMGVLSMQERATLIGGQLEIESIPGQGSIVCLRCPVRMRVDMS